MSRSGRFGMRNAGEAFLTLLLQRVNAGWGKGGKHVP